MLIKMVKFSSEVVFSTAENSGCMVILTLEESEAMGRWFEIKGSSSLKTVGSDL